jgi:hypothetical protein
VVHFQVEKFYAIPFCIFPHFALLLWAVNQMDGLVVKNADDKQNKKCG